MAKSAPRLGKGLSALIGPRTSGPFRSRLDGDGTTDEATANAAPGASGPGTSSAAGEDVSAQVNRPAGADLRELPIDQVHPNPNQPRTVIDDDALAELAESVRQSGVLQPVIVRPLDAGGYEIVAGERRWRAAKLAERDVIPAIVRKLTDAEAFEIALIENLQREDLGPLERATAYQQLIDTLDVSADEVAARLGESRSNVANYLRLLNLQAEVRELVGNGSLGMGQARAIAGIRNPQRQLAIARLAVRRNLAVRQVELLAKEPERGGSSSDGSSRESRDGHVSDIEQALSKGLGLPVALQPGKKKNSGRIVIKYNSLEEFDIVAEKLGGKEFLE